MIMRQDETLLIGSRKAIKALEDREHARLLVISDSHGNSGILCDIIKRYGKDCDAFIFCGDGLGDLAALFSQAGSDKELAAAIPEVSAFARGNCDPGEYPVGWKRLRAPIEQELTVNGHRLMIVHGHAHGVDFGMERLGLEMKLNGCDCAFYGHTHVAAFEQEGEFKFVNPGSCARPRGGQPAGFAIATIEKTFIDIAFIKCQDFSLWQPIM